MLYQSYDSTRSQPIKIGFSVSVVFSHWNSVATKLVLTWPELIKGVPVDFRPNFDCLFLNRRRWDKSDSIIKTPDRKYTVFQYPMTLCPFWRHWADDCYFKCYLLLAQLSDFDEIITIRMKIQIFVQKWVWNPENFLEKWSFI